MAKPLRSDDPTPQNMQFAHFGVLNDGNQSKSSLFTSIALNVVLALSRFATAGRERAPSGRLSATRLLY